MAGSIFIAVTSMAHIINAAPLPHEAIKRRAPTEDQTSARQTVLQATAIVVSSALVASILISLYLLHSRSRAHRDRVEFRNMALYYKTALQATLDSARNGTLDLTQAEPWLPHSDRRAFFYTLAPRAPQIAAIQASMFAYPHSLSTITERTERSTSPYSTETPTIAGPSCERPPVAGPLCDRHALGDGPLTSNPIEMRELRRPRRLSGEKAPAATTDKGKGKEVELTGPEASPR
jgi:hypothetical protein